MRAAAERPGTATRLAIYLFLALLVVCAVRGIEWWPLTGWKLFSHVRTGTHPSPSGGAGSAVLVISAQNTPICPSLSSPPSGQNHRLRI